MAKTPEMPTLLFGLENEDQKTYDWLGGNLKNILTMEERSASGLNKTAGVILLSIAENSVLEKSDIQVGDVIVACYEDEIDTITDLIKSYQNHNWRGKLDLKVFRNQKEITITIGTKK